MTMDRIPVTVIEIDQDRCALTFSQGACPATGEPCWNTRATCKATQAYTLGDPLTLRFSMRDRAEGFAEYVIPMVDSVRTSPTRINVGGRRGREKPLGIRAEATVTLSDAPHSDLLVDHYVDQRNYDPLERSTFWAKWLKRNPFYSGRSMRIREGYAGQALADMQTRHYVLDNIEGPDSNGRVTVKAQDVLRLADDDKAQAPRLSNGILALDVEESDTTLEVTRGTLAEYTQYGTNAIRIGDEVIRYSSITTLGSGNLRFNNLQRGTDGTEPQSHDAEDSVQACLEYIDREPWDIARELLVDYGNVDAAFINDAEWESENDRWLAPYPLRRLLTEPVGVTTLLGELSEQALFYLWWDEFEQQVRFRAVAPTIGLVPVLSERNHLLRDSVKITVRPEQRATEVWVNFLPINATETGNERKHYRRTRTRVDPDASSPQQYGDRRTYEVFSAWLTLDIQASLLAFFTLSSFRDAPAYLSFALDPKDRDVAVGDEFDIEYRGFVDETGQPERIRYRVISTHEDPPGERIKIEAQRSQFGVDQRFGLWMPDDAPDYTDASDLERSEGFFWANDDGLMPNGDDPYLWI